MLLWRPSGARGSRSSRDWESSRHLRRLASSLVAARPPRATCSAALSRPLAELRARPEARNQRPSHRSLSSTKGPSRLAEGSSTLRPGALDNALSRRCAISTPRGANRCHRAASTPPRRRRDQPWATPTTASSSARTCYLQLGHHIVRTARPRPTLRVMYHPDTPHREGRRSCSTSIKSS